MTENEMAGSHRLNEREFEQTLGDGKGQGSLVCCSPWGRKELDTMKNIPGGGWRGSRSPRSTVRELQDELCNLHSEVETGPGQ